MLLQYSVENFQSIRDRITLSMVASNDDLLKDNTIKFNNINLLKSIAIYGPNASGKTNILLSITYLTHLIKDSHKNQPGDEMVFLPFRLDKRCEGDPTKFEIIFEIDGTKYTYGCSLDQNKVYAEYLYYYPNKRRRIIFTRDINNPKTYTFPIDEKRQEVIKENTAENMLYLSRSANMNYEKTSIIVKWFSEKIRSILQVSYIQGIDGYTKKFCASDESLKPLVIKSFISKADRGIKGFNIEDIQVDEDVSKDLIRFPKDIRELLLEDMRRRVEFYHKGLDIDRNEIDVVFDLSDESKGTRKMFNWAGPFLDVLENGRLLVIDEFERSLHPHLVCYLIKLFNDDEFNKNGAQLIIATHSPYLLNPDILRRDQVWFADKSKEQSTELHSLYEYKARKFENIEKGYLAGRYGAIPNLD